MSFHRDMMAFDMIRSTACLPRTRVILLFIHCCIVHNMYKGLPFKVFSADWDKLPNDWVWVQLFVADQLSITDEIALFAKSSLCLHDIPFPPRFTDDFALFAKSHVCPIDKPHSPVSHSLSILVWLTARLPRTRFIWFFIRCCNVHKMYKGFPFKVFSADWDKWPNEWVWGQHIVADPLSTTDDVAPFAKSPVCLDGKPFPSFSCAFMISPDREPASASSSAIAMS